MNRSLVSANKAPAVFAQPWVRALSALGLAAGVWALSAGASNAHAGDVYWSVGVQSPGVQLGVSNAPPAPVYVHRPRPQAVYVQPTPVVVYPGYRHVRQVREVVPVVREPVVVYQNAPQYVVVDPWGARVGRGHGGRRDRHDGNDRYDRHDRDDRNDWRERGHGHRH